MSGGEKKRYRRLTALALISPSLGYAQETPTPQRTAEREHLRPSPEDLKAFTYARIADLKAGLKLTGERGPAVEQAIRDMAKARQERMAGGIAPRVKGEDAIARIRARADAMTQSAAELRKLADADEPLYQLNDNQKRQLRFTSFT